MEDQGAQYTRHHTPSTGGREDCWSEGATVTLIEAWGDRYLQLSRGNLRQKDWKEVADAVNSRQDSLNKPRKTDIQCKNRIDTLKKKYKVEKSKVTPSRWPFYHRLDSLIGTTASTPISNNNSSRKFLNLVKTAPSVKFTVKNVKNPNLNPISVAYSAGSSSKSRMNSAGSSETSRGGNRDDEDDNDVLNNNVVVGDDGVRKHRQDSVEDLPGASGSGSAFRELARAILKFGEIYERIESAKQQQMMELERQRMEFTKELEFQRMQMFMEAQLEVEKMKRPKYSSIAGKKLSLQ